MDRLSFFESHFERSSVKPEGFRHEHNDCVVQSIASAFSLPYAEVHKALAIRGRKDRRGTNMFVYEPYIAGMGATRFLSKAKTLGTFCRRHRSGIFLVRISGHLTTVVNGKVVDSFLPGLRCRIKSVWTVRSKAADNEVTLAIPIPYFQNRADRGLSNGIVKKQGKSNVTCMVSRDLLERIRVDCRKHSVGKGRVVTCCRWLLSRIEEKLKC